MAERQDIGENGDMGVMCDMSVSVGEEACQAPPSGEVSNENNVPRATRQQVSAAKAAVNDAVRAWEHQKHEVQQAIGEAADAVILRRESGQLTLCLAEVKSAYKIYSRLIESDAQMEVQVNDVIEYTDELVRAAREAIRQAAMETESIRSSVRNTKTTLRTSFICTSICSSESIKRIYFLYTALTSARRNDNCPLSRLNAEASAASPIACCTACFCRSHASIASITAALLALTCCLVACKTLLSLLNAPLGGASGASSAAMTFMSPITLMSPFSPTA